MGTSQEFDVIAFCPECDRLVQVNKHGQCRCGNRFTSQIGPFRYDKEERKRVEVWNKMYAILGKLEAMLNRTPEAPRHPSFSNEVHILEECS